MLGRGGMGEVRRVRDRRFGRVLAMKLALPVTDRPARMRRFEKEVQIAAQLQHPGIMPVYDAGIRPDGRSYSAMKWCSSLIHLARGRAVTVRCLVVGWHQCAGGGCEIDVGDLAIVAEHDSGRVAKPSSGNHQLYAASSKRVHSQAAQPVGTLIERDPRHASNIAERLRGMRATARAA